MYYVHIFYIIIYFQKFKKFTINGLLAGKLNNCFALYYVL